MVRVQQKEEAGMEAQRLVVLVKGEMVNSTKKGERDSNTFARNEGRGEIANYEQHRMWPMWHMEDQGQGSW
jgi:hypothetical protein